MFNMKIDDFVSYTVTGITAFGRATVWPVFSLLEQYIFGKGRAYLSNPDRFRGNLILKARTSSEGVATESLGIIGGNMSVVVPASQQEMAAMIDHLDTEKKGRDAHFSFKFFSGTSSMIISETGEEAIFHRKQLMQFLVPGKYVQPVIAKIHNTISSKNEQILRELVCGVVRAVLMELILGVDALPESTYQIMKKYRSDVKAWAAFPIPGLFQFMPSLRKKRDTYRLFAQEILDGQFDNIVREIRKGTPQLEMRNLILLTMIELIRNDYPRLNEHEFSQLLKNLSIPQIKKYFNHDSVKTLPMLLKAADNLTDAITLCLEKLASNKSAVRAIYQEIQTVGLGWEKEHAQLLSLKQLDAWYKESLRMDTPIMVPRYTTKGITYNAVKIPPHTTILFDLHAINKGSRFWKDPDTFSHERFLCSREDDISSAYALNQYPLLPFSAGRRMCPAFKVTEHIFKAFIAGVITQFQLDYVGNIEGEVCVAFTPLLDHTAAAGAQMSI